MFLVLIGVLMSIIVVLPAYWAMPSDGGQRRMTAREWQVMYICPCPVSSLSAQEHVSDKEETRDNECRSVQSL